MTDNMVTSTIESAEQLVEFLTNQHDELKKMLPAVLEAKGDERARRFDQVRRTLAAHEALEQSTVHLVARELEGDEMADGRMEEESEAEDAIGELEDMDVDSDEFEQAFAKLQADVLEHAEHEEQQEFPGLGGDLTEVGRIRAGVGMRLAADSAEGGDLLAGGTFEQMFQDAKVQIQQVGPPRDTRAAEDHPADDHN